MKRLKLLLLCCLAALLTCAAPGSAGDPAEHARQLKQLETKIRTTELHLKSYERMLDKANAEYAYVKRKRYIKQIPLKEQKIAQIKMMIAGKQEELKEQNEQRDYLTSTTVVVEDTLLATLPDNLQPNKGQPWDNALLGPAMEWINKQVIEKILNKPAKITIPRPEPKNDAAVKTLTHKESFPFQWGPIKFAELTVTMSMKDDKQQKQWADAPVNSKILVEGVVTDFKMTENALSITLDQCTARYSVFVQ